MFQARQQPARHITGKKKRERERAWGKERRQKKIPVHRPPPQAARLPGRSRRECCGFSDERVGAGRADRAPHPTEPVAGPEQLFAIQESLLIYTWDCTQRDSS
jgi:hypothetical protein